MAAHYGLQGLQKTLLNVNKQTSKIKNKTKEGMISAGLHIEAEAKRNTPIDTGNLRASGYTTWDTAPGSALAVEIGFTAHYAIHVHEIKKNYHGGDWKFLERAIAENEGEILQEIVSRAGGF